MKKKEKLKILYNLSNNINYQLTANKEGLLGGDNTGCNDKKATYNCYDFIIDFNKHCYNDNNTYNGYLTYPFYD
ncbi:MAG: hypothetical protein U0V03_02835 [Bacteroidia bacterium]